MQMGTKTCVLLLWIQTLSFVKCQSASGCWNPPNLADGDLKESMKPEYDHNESVEYICQRHHIMEGTGRRTCVNGAWTGEIKCLKPCTVNQRDMDERNIRFARGRGTKMYAEPQDHITFACKRAGQVSSVPLRQQCVDGVMELPTCKDQYYVGQCERLQDEKLTVNLSMDKDSYKNGEVIEYVCNAHDAGDKNTATCVDGKWNTTVECPGPSGCQKPPNLADGDVKESMKPEYDHNESVEYMCQRLYIMEGTGQRTCVNGAWTGEIKCLKPCTVNQGDMDERNIKFVYGGRTKMYAEHEDHITFACKRAGQVSSLPLRQQCVDGVMELPTCKDQY
ncbi:complement factor H-like [Cololabis saira]|uniref:complement factor H-like n=1 Tax=Cololabis saira TaxID=129043 RepID=UPI002AD307E4|nr:complement factor H-like [Cololabis saira]